MNVWNNQELVIACLFNIKPVPHPNGKKPEADFLPVGVA